MSERPELNKKLDAATFRSFYYLKQELADFCKENGLPTSGSKAELTDRIAYFLDTGNVLKSSAERKTAVNIGTLTEDTVIEPNIVCSEKHRAFFSEKIGKGFSFHVPFQKWLKANAGKTYGDAIRAYYRILEEKKLTKTEIGGQFEYNTYIRDFFADNPGKNLHDAIVYTETNFNRPGFGQLISDIEMGYIYAVMVKDLSRLGRDYVSVGNYTDVYFPDHDIRFIAVNDGIDSEEGESEIAPFKNILNEMYARDISKKIRSSHRLRGSMGEPLSQPPYGYMKSAENKKKWVIDPEAAEVVKSVFKMCLEGKGNETIARILQEKQILVPMAYWQSKGLPRGGKKTQPNPYKWCKTTIQKVLSQQEYCGDVINFKTCSKSFKNKTRLPNNPENWAIFKDVHEPIIARGDFEKVQRLIAKTKRRAPKPKNGEKSIFCDLLFCGDCHGKLRHHTNTINKNIHYFVCANNKVDYRGECSGRHYVRADAIEQVVMLELRRMAEFLVSDEEAFAELLAQKTDKELLKEKKYDEAELQKAIARNDTVSHLYEKLYEDNAVGKVSDEWFMQLSHKYEAERLELKAKIKALRQKLSECGQHEQERENFTSAIRRFMRMDRLTAPLLRELIDHIDVFETEGKGKNRTQRIVIYYRFVGYVEIPEVSRRPNIVADTRKGVAVEYLTEPKTA